VKVGFARFAPPYRPTSKRLVGLNLHLRLRGALSWRFRWTSPDRLQTRSDGLARRWRIAGVGGGLLRNAPAEPGEGVQAANARLRCIVRLQGSDAAHGAERVSQ
jgi:hypothetical protein